MPALNMHEISVSGGCGLHCHAVVNEMIFPILKSTYYKKFSRTKVMDPEYTLSYCSGIDERLLFKLRQGLARVARARPNNNDIFNNTEIIDSSTCHKVSISMSDSTGNRAIDP